jgi:polysaccharide pyruvyl transferase WcaK-like protein
VPSKNPDSIKSFLPDRVVLYNTTTSYLSFLNFKHLTGADVLIFGGGGLFFDKSIFNPFYNHIINLFIISLLNKLFFKKEIYIFGVGSSHLRSKLAIFMTKFILNNSDFISVRDTHTFDLFSQLSTRSVQVFYDPAFLLSPKKSKIVDEFISANPSFDNKASSKKIIFALNDFLFSIKKEGNYTDDLINVINRLQDNHQVVLYQNDNKCEFITGLFEKCRQDRLNIFNPKDLSPEEIIYLFSKFDLAICAPMHAAIFSYDAGVEFITIGYDDKIEEFNKIVENENFVQLDKLSNILDMVDNKKMANFQKKEEIKTNSFDNFINFFRFINNVKE